VKTFILGRGVLTWDANERRSDRYGTVFLMEEGHDSWTAGPSLITEDICKEAIGLKGGLLVRVLETRESTHIGDLMRGIFPKRPKVNTQFELGQGTFFIERAHDGGVQVGLRPPDPSKRDWLNPRALYAAHEQTVELVFVNKRIYKENVGLPVLSRRIDKETKGRAT
jgi:hypothetical protein